MKLPEHLTQDEDGNIRLTGHRIGLQDVVRFYNEGYSPEMLIGQFPTLTLPLVHKLIAFYLENLDVVDAYVSRCRADLESQAAAAPRGPDMAELRRRMRALYAEAS